MVLTNDEVRLIRYLHYGLGWKAREIVETFYPSTGIGYPVPGNPKSKKVCLATIYNVLTLKTYRDVPIVTVLELPPGYTLPTRPGAGRGYNKTKPPNPYYHHNQRKLTAEAVRSIRSKRSSNPAFYTYRRLAQEYNVSFKTIQHVCENKFYKDVEPSTATTPGTLSEPELKPFTVRRGTARQGKTKAKK